MSASSHTKTLGDVLYANRARSFIPESHWCGLIRSIAVGDQVALHALYEHTHRLVFTLTVRITKSRETAEELTLHVFHDIWRDASRYDAAGASVLGWIMNQARSRALDRLRFDPEDPAALDLTVLTPDERHAIESAYFSELSYADVATRLNQPLGILRTRIHSGLGKLRQALAGEVRETLSPASANPRCDQAESVSAYVLHALPSAEVTAAEAHIYACSDCQQEMRRLRPIIDSFVSWPTDVLRASASLRTRLACRIAAETGAKPQVPQTPPWPKPEWEDVAPGISCKLFSTDLDKERVSMLVRLAPGVDYPPHTHAGVEEVHLLHGELWIDDRRLNAGDHNRAEPGTADQHVWSERGCTCVLITSIRDALH